MNTYFEEPPRYEAKGPEDVQHDAQVLIDSFIRPVEFPGGRSPYATGLPMPFCLPQTGSGFDSPIARGYN